MSGDGDSRLDGNALGGVLGEIFALEITTAQATCATCGARGETAGLVVYARGPGAVARCRVCDSVVLRVVDDGLRIWLDARGVRSLELRRPG